MAISSQEKRQRRRPAKPVTFALGLILLSVGVLCLVASAFVESELVNTLTAGLVPGVILTPFGWLGR